MEYRLFCGESVSVLGFGCMRFPQTPDGHIDEDAALTLLDSAHRAGVNYFDTAYPYHNGESEPFLGSYLSTLPRNDFFVATKLPVWEVNSADDARRLLQLQLDRLRTGYIDFYLLHALSRDRFEKMVSLGVIDCLESEQRAGRIRRLGFSFHDTYDVFEQIASYRKWDFCQIQYNYMDTEDQAGERGRALAGRLGIPLIVMEPVKGGSLARLPAGVARPFTDVHPGKSQASWALRYAAGQRGVALVLSGMSSGAQLADNIGTFSPFSPLNAKELDAVAAVKAAVKSRTRNGCTACRYCMPCPYGVDIPRNFSLWNGWGMYEDRGSTAFEWNMLAKEKKSADLCRKCGACESKCPQHLHIRDDLETLRKELAPVLSPG